MSSPCTALNNAMKHKGYTPSQIAEQVGSQQSRISDIITGKERPTQQEFNKLAEVLNITDQAPRNPSHSTA